METLYRKYRSQTFGELVGQKQATQILRNAIRRGRLSHAYLFCGPRGTGKTSVARIFAKALSCLNPQDGDCCGTCEHCLQIAGGQALDVQEIDAASKNKVEDIRDLRDRVGYAPAKFPYKIYIIDEVHMVTAQGFNALLKTLEEPPPHVKFLLCTTEAHKLPVTILSRCIRLDFTRIALPELAAHLQWIAAQEGFAQDEDAALEVAALAEGSARDAISLLDQLTVYCDERITRADVRELFQLGDPDLVPRVVRAIELQQQRELLDTWEHLAGQGADAGRFLLQLASALKDQYINSGEPAWRRALESIWQGLNLLKQESFPALLVELSLLQAAEAFAAKQVPVRTSSESPLPAGSPVATASSPAGGRKPEFLRRPASQETPAAPVVPLQPLTRSTESPPAASVPASSSQTSLRSEVSPAPAPLTGQLQAFMQTLRERSLASYVLVSQFAQLNQGDNTLEIAFLPGLAWARPACAFAQLPELLQAMSEAAELSLGSPQLRLGIQGEDTGWKQSGFPFDLGTGSSQSGSPAAEQSAKPGQIPASEHALFRRKTTTAQPSDIDLELAEAQAELREASVPELPSTTPSGTADTNLERLGQQLDRAAKMPVENPATLEDVLELFGAELIDGPS